VPASFASVNYWGVHGFGFTNAQGATTWGKWLFEPAGGVQGLNDEEAKAKGADFLFADLRQRVAAGKARFDFNLELAEAGDPLDNPTIPLPAGRKKVNLGQLHITQVEAECQKLYGLLQHSVDQEIQQVGFVPSPGYGSNGSRNGNGRTYPINGNGRHPGGFNGSNGHPQPRAVGDQWNCTDGQKGFIQRIVNENHLDKGEVDDLANQLFGSGVKQLNKMQASQLIEDLLVKAGKPPTRQTRWQQQPTQTQPA